MKILVLTIAALFSGSAQAASNSWCKEKPFQLKTQLGDQRFYDRSCALVITASSYAAFGKVWGDLPNEKEADNFRDALQGIGFDVLRIPNVTSKNLRSSLESFCSSDTSESARLLIYFSGHGQTIRDNSLVGYILPEDIVDDMLDLPTFKKQAVSTEDILRLSTKCKAKHLIFILDSCFSAALFKTKSKALTASSLPSVILADDLGRRSRQFITSSDAKTTSPAGSVLTPKLIEGIRGNAAIPGLGMITGKSLGLWARHAVSSSDVTPTVPQFGDVNSEQGGDFIFVAGGAKSRNEKLSTIIDSAQGAYYSVFKRINLVYYRKASDGSKIMESLERADIPFIATKNNRNPETFSTNTIACHSEGDIAAVKTLAKILVKDGVEIMEILQFAPGGAKARNRIELLNDAKFSYGKAAPLSMAQIDALTSCPRMLSNPIRKEKQS